LENPLSYPPLLVLKILVTTETIQNHPKITCNINIDTFEALLIDHPQPYFVHSVIIGFV
jgi:hypothetical protein